MHIESDMKLDFRDVSLKPKRSNLSSRQEVDITRTFKFKYSGVEWSGVPIISSNMVSVSTPGILEAFIESRMIVCLHKYVSVDDIRGLRDKHGTGLKNSLMISCGIGDDALPFLQQCDNVLGELFNFICIDVANGYSHSFFDFCKKIRNEYPEKTIIAGNVVTSELLESLILDAGVDVIKVGLGSGASCKTREITGCGVPQLSAIIDCADSAHGLGAHVISDGGCVVPGDISKSFCAGADFTMIGSMLAGHKENSSKIIEKSGEMFVEHFGMSSLKANEEFAGGMKAYRASEGRHLLIPYKGSIQGTIQTILGGIRSCGTYIGARRLKEFSRRATFIRVNSQLNESLKQYEV